MPSAPYSILPRVCLPIALLVLFARRAFLLFVIIGVAWIGLVIYSAARDARDGEHCHRRYRAGRVLEDGSAVRHKG